MFSFFVFVIGVSLFFGRLVHPLSMGLALLVQTCLVCVSAGIGMSSFWFSYIMFLIFLGGMLVLFIYVASLASNEVFSGSVSWIMFFMLCVVVALALVFVDGLSIKVSMENSMPGLFFSSHSMLISSVYSSLSMNFTLYMVLYLLLTLFVIVEITGSKGAPLRVSTYDSTSS